jgi:hypothetical protein
MSAVITCRACGNRHGSRYLCDPLQEVVRAMMDEAEKHDMPVQEFAKNPPPAAEPHEVHALGGLTHKLGPDAMLVRQVLVKAGVLEIAGMNRPVLIFTGLDADNRPLPNWTFPGSPYELRAIRNLVDEMTEMAIRRARGSDDPPA